MASIKIVAQTLTLISLSSLLIVKTSAAVNSTTKSRPTISSPKFYLASQINTCQVDSPELFYYEVVLPSINSLLDEGKIFFGVLMERLESSLAGSEKYEYLSKEWAFLMNVINESFELAVGRIELVWDAIIDQNDLFLLPWEFSLRTSFMLELFNNLLDEYQVVEAVVQAGTKEIVNTLQKYFLEVMEKLEDSVYYESSPEGEPKTEAQLLDRMEKASSKLEPNFVGALLQKLIRKAKAKKLHVWKSSSVNFLALPVQDISLLKVAFQATYDSSPLFWSEWTSVLRSVNGSVIMSSQDIFELYSSDEGLLIDSVISLLTMDLEQ